MTMEVTNRWLRAAYIAASINDLDSLSDVINKALQVIRDPNSERLVPAKDTDLDPELMTRVIALANAASFGASRRFETAEEALASQGRQTFQLTLYAAAASSSLCRPITLYDMGRKQLWRHSIACAVSARLIAQEFKLCDPQQAYLTGLLHDIGLPALERFVRQRVELSRLIKTAEFPPFMSEQMVLGSDHADLGGLIAQRWQLPTEVADAIAHHHDPLASDSRSQLASVVNVADAVSLLPEICKYNPYYSITVDSHVMDWLGLRRSDIDRLVPTVQQYLTEIEILVNAA